MYLKKFQIYWTNLYLNKFLIKNSLIESHLSPIKNCKNVYVIFKKINKPNIYDGSQLLSYALADHRRLFRVLAIIVNGERGADRVRPKINVILELEKKAYRIFAIKLRPLRLRSVGSVEIK